MQAGCPFIFLQIRTPKAAAPRPLAGRGAAIARATPEAT
jgi:hypothetical protein